MKDVGFIGPITFLSDLTVGPTYFAKSEISGGLSSGFICISYEKFDFLTPCPELIMVYKTSICHVLHCPYIPTPISSRNF